MMERGDVRERTLGRERRREREREVRWVRAGRVRRWPEVRWVMRASREAEELGVVGWGERRGGGSHRRVAEAAQEEGVEVT